MSDAGKRFTNIDLLRIFSMFLIIFLHSVDHSGVLELAEEKGSPAVFGYVFFVYFLCQICVNLFVLISGYFMVNSKFRITKLIGLWTETVFYSLLFKIIFMAARKAEFSAISLVSCLIPVFTGRYWFITIYFGMYLVFPFLNILISHLSPKQFTALNLSLFLLFSVWISFSYGIKGMNSGAGWGLPWFVVLYLAGAWFRTCYQMKDTGAGRYFLLWFLAAGVITALLLVFRNSGMAYDSLRNLFRYDSVPVYLSSLLVFAGFLRFRQEGRNAGFIHKISTATFGVYLIHAHANVSPWLWYEGVPLADHVFDGLFPLMHFGTALLVFAVCTCVSLMFSRLINSMSSGISRYAAGPIQNVYERILNGILRFAENRQGNGSV